jgi:hypothetical protein
MHTTWNSGHEKQIGEAIAGLTALLLALAILTWPLAIDRPAKGSGGGCCKVTEHRNGR